MFEKEITNEKKLNKYLGWLVFLIALLGYFLTVAPTTSYWDCGEFIASSYILGVPHPPGAPFFLLLGRLFSMIPFVDDIGLRVNAVSVISSALTVLFLYLTTVRLIKFWKPEVLTVSDLLMVNGAAALGALTYAFTETFWFNAVEAEVYALSMFFTSIIVWLIMVWIDKHKSTDGDRYLLLIMLLVGLGTGVHLLNILTIPTLLLIMWFFDRRITVIAGVGMLLSVAVLFGFPLEMKIWSVFIFLGISIFLGRNKDHSDYSLAFIMPLLLIIGYSTYIFVYLRAGLNPPINENDPSNWERMLAYLNREQYGESDQMGNAVKFFFALDPNRKYLDSLEKLGVAAGSAGDPWKGHWNFFWNYQVKEMYLRYFNWQFIGQDHENIKQIVSFKGLMGIPFFAGLAGLIHHFTKDKKRAVAYFLLFIIMSLGLVIYQNQDVLQPRERDYFYVGSFYVFGIWIAMGISAIIEFFKETPILKKLVIPLFLICFIIPSLEVKANYFTGNRSGNYLAWDYSKNILETCDPNAILFTNGDNDTFPLWYLQIVEGIRTDVTIVNLSLLNTDWYIKQIKRKLPQFIDYTDREIELMFGQSYYKDGDDGKPLFYTLPPKEQAILINAYQSREWKEPKKLQLKNKDGSDFIKWTMKPTFGNHIKVQDQMVLELVAKNAMNGWKTPIYFAVTVASSNYIGLDDYLRMDGLCYKVVDYKARRGIDPEVLFNRVFVKFKDHYRNLGDKNVYYNENKIRLLQNYRSAFLQLGLHYLDDIKSKPDHDIEIDFNQNLDFSSFSKLDKYEKAAYILNKMEAIIPSSNIPYASEGTVLEIATLYQKIGQEKLGEELIKNINLSRKSLDDRLRLVMVAASKGYAEYAARILDENLPELLNRKGERKLRDLMELYAGISSFESGKIVAEKLKKAMDTELAKITNSKDRNTKISELAIFMYQAGNKEETHRLLDKILAEDKYNQEANYLKAEIYSMEKDYKKALEIYDRILEQNPEDKTIKRKHALVKKLVETGQRIDEN